MISKATPNFILMKLLHFILLFYFKSQKQNNNVTSFFEKM